MMKLRKIWALVLAVAMIALTGAAFATSAGLDQDIDLTDGSTVISEQGVLQSGTDNGSGTAATYASVGNTVTIEKDLTKGTDYRRISIKGESDENTSA